MMAFGRTPVSDADGNYKGPLMLSLEEGSLLVIGGNSSNMSRHEMCQSPNKRVSIKFSKVRFNTNQYDSSTIPPLNRAMTLGQPGIPNSYAIPNRAMSGYKATMGTIPKWGVLCIHVVKLAAPMHPRSEDNDEDEAKESIFLIKEADDAAVWFYIF